MSAIKELTQLRSQIPSEDDWKNVDEACRWRAFDDACEEHSYFIRKAEWYLKVFYVGNDDITQQNMVQIFDIAIKFAKLIAFD